MQVYPCVGTPFEKTRTPLTHWFLAIYLFAISKNGMSACELQRNIGVTYKTAFRMLQQIRKLIQNDESLLSGVIELDETYVGGKNKNRHYDKKAEKSQGRAYVDKAPVFGMIERDGRVIAYQVPDVKGTTLKPIIFKKIEVGSDLMTDEFNVYSGLGKFYNHQICDHGKKQYVNGKASTNCMENFWSVVKRTINGSYIHVSKKYLQLYINEVVFRFNNRHKTQIFNEFINLLAS
jgi:transposase-like protein